jgi:hypothetical protein
VDDGITETAPEYIRYSTFSYPLTLIRQPQPASSLLKAVAHGRQWHGTNGSRLKEWKSFKPKGPIAQKLALTEKYVRRILECAFLAPDIVESILAGTFGLTVENLENSLKGRRRVGLSNVGSSGSWSQPTSNTDSPS